MVMSPFMKTMSNVASIKQTLTALPIVQKQVNVSPLVVGDDLALRTSLTSPVFYDKEMVKLLHKHSEFIEEADRNMTYPAFIRHLSNIDKLSLLWALFKSTYETLGKRQFTCKKENCENSKKPFEVEVLLNDIIHEDTFTLWDEEVPFEEFVYQIDIPYENLVYSFNAKLPSIEDNNRILSTMSTDSLQKNLESLGTVYSRAQNMALLVKAIQLSGNKENPEFEPVNTDNIQEILMAFNSYVPYGVSEEFLTKYSEKFDKYLPKFYKIEKCPICGEEVKNEFDLEVEFFRRSLFS